MLICLLSFLAAAASGIATVVFLRRTLNPGVAVKPQPVQVAVELPAELQHLPEPPVLPESPVQILDRTEILRRLRGLELGVAELGEPREEHEHIVASALACTAPEACAAGAAAARPHSLYFGGSKPLARQRSAIAAEVSAAMKARAAAGSVLLAGIAAA